MRSLPQSAGPHRAYADTHESSTGLVLTDALHTFKILPANVASFDSGHSLRCCGHRLRA
jgi:hypothetical protein